MVNTDELTDSALQDLIDNDATPANIKTNAQNELNRRRAASTPEPSVQDRIDSALDSAREQGETRRREMEDRLRREMERLTEPLQRIPDEVQSGFGDIANRVGELGQGFADRFISPEDQDKFKAQMKRALDFVQKQRGLAKEYEDDPTGFVKNQLGNILNPAAKAATSKAMGLEGIGDFIQTSKKAKARLGNRIREVDSRQKDLYTGAPKQTTYEGPPQFSRSRSMKQMGFSQGKKRK